MKTSRLTQASKNSDMCCGKNQMDVSGEKNAALKSGKIRERKTEKRQWSRKFRGFPDKKTSEKIRLTEQQATCLSRVKR